MAEASASIRLNRIAVPIGNLGYGQRAAIWVQGCTIGCSGCIARHTWNRKGGEILTVVDLAELIERLETRSGRLDGLTISGGEPMEQSEAVFSLVELLRERQWLGKRRDVLVYSGLGSDELEQRFGVQLDAFDALVAEPYDELVEGNGLMGSGNQRVVMRTEIGRRRYGGIAQPSRPLEGTSDGRTFLLSGIPKREETAQFAALLGEYGLRLS